MGVVDFDPEKWSRANCIDEAPDVAKAAKVAKVESASPPLSQLSQLSQVARVPNELRAGIEVLRSMPPPRLILPEVWPGVVADALMLAREGWAAKALALGWDALDLYGAVTDRDGYADADGLAVWLAGRPLLAICETYASVGDDTGRAYFNRCNRLGPTLLWNVGR